MQNINDTLLPVTPSMERYTIQCNSLRRAIANFGMSPRPYSRSVLIVFVNEFMDKNEHDELGNWVDIAEIVENELK